jgi:hypothetical protein
MGGAVGPSSPTPTVVASEELDLERELAERAERGTLARTVWVTDLLDLRKAFWSRLARPPIPEERQQALLEGRRFHARLLRRLAPAEHREVRVRRDGIAGSIDMFDTIPVELKTTGRIPQVSSLVQDRPAYVEQLAMYGALVGRSTGRLVLVEGGVPPPSAAIVVDVSMGPTEELDRSMLARAERLRDAWAHATPDRLPRCAWVGRGCEYEEGGICDCTGEEPLAPADALSNVLKVEERPEEARRILEAARALAHEAPPLVESFRDLAYPRRAYFERTEPVPEGSGGGGFSPGREDLWAAVNDLLEAGPAGDVERRFAATGEPSEGVLCFRGSPVLVKSTRARRGRSSSEIPTRQPHYILELGLRCAAVGIGEGRLILAYENARAWKDRLEVVRVRFEPLERWQELAKTRREELSGSLSARDPGRASACPRWMLDRCAYRAVCGCGGAAPAGGPQR